MDQSSAPIYDIAPLIFTINQRRSLNKKIRSDAYQDYLLQEFCRVNRDNNIKIQIAIDYKQPLFLYQHIETWSPAYDDISKKLYIGSFKSDFTEIMFDPYSEEEYVDQHITFTPEEFRSQINSERINVGARTNAGSVEKIRYFDVALQGLIKYFKTDNSFKELRDEGEQNDRLNNLFKKMLDEFVDICIDNYITVLPQAVVQYWLDRLYNSLGIELTPEAKLFNETYMDLQESYFNGHKDTEFESVYTDQMSHSIDSLVDNKNFIDALKDYS